MLEEKVYRKLKYVAFISAKRRFSDGFEYFYYYNLILYKLKSFNVFLKLIEDGKIRISFKLGVFRSGTRIGKIHDHGTAFTISKEDFDLLFDKFDFN